MTLLLIVQSAINTHEFYSCGIVAGFQRRPDAAKSLRPAPRNFKCGADRLRRVRLVGHLMLPPEFPLALTLHRLLPVFVGFSSRRFAPQMLLTHISLLRFSKLSGLAVW